MVTGQGWLCLCSAISIVFFGFASFTVIKDVGWWPAMSKPQRPLINPRQMLHLEASPDSWRPLALWGCPETWEKVASTFMPPELGWSASPRDMVLYKVPPVYQISSPCLPYKALQNFPQALPIKILSFCHPSQLFAPEPNTLGLSYLMGWGLSKNAGSNTSIWKVKRNHLNHFN